MTHRLSSILERYKNSANTSNNSTITILDEDDFVSNREDAVPSQQSVKSYIDSFTAPSKFWRENIGGETGYVGEGGLAISSGATSNDLAISIGIDANAGFKSISFGNNSISTGVESIALGTDAEVTANNAIQLGAGNNNIASTLKFLGSTLANNGGLITSYSPTNYTVANNNIDSHFAGIDNILSSGGGEPYVEINSTGTLPVSTGTGALAIGGFTISTSINTIAIGTSAEATSINSLALGAGAEASAVTSISIGNNSSSNSVDSISLGHTARAFNREAIAIGNDSRCEGRASVAIGNLSYVTADSSVQIGEGTNSTLNTLQFRSHRIANNNGLYTSFNNPINYTPSNSNNVTSHFQAIDAALETAVASASKSFYTTNRETLSFNKQLQSNDPNIQILTNETSGALTVNLPANPVLDTFFLIASTKNSNGPINVNTIVIYPGDRLELIYDGTEWFSL